MSRVVEVNGVRMTYGEYLKTDGWVQRRRDAILRANFTCQLCGWSPERHTFQGFAVHHNNYEHVGNELPHEIVALCKDCHDTYHALNKKKTRRKRHARQRIKDVLRSPVNKQFIGDSPKRWRTKRNHLVCKLLDADPRLLRIDALRQANQLMRQAQLDAPT